MRYLVIQPPNEPFITDWFEYANHYAVGMVVFDLRAFRYTEDGITWKDIPIDHL